MKTGSAVTASGREAVSNAWAVFPCAVSTRVGISASGTRAELDGARAVGSVDPHLGVEKNIKDGGRKGGVEVRQVGNRGHLPPGAARWTAPLAPLASQHAPVPPSIVLGPSPHS